MYLLSGHGPIVLRRDDLHRTSASVAQQQLDGLLVLQRIARAQGKQDEAEISKLAIEELLEIGVPIHS